MLPQQFNSHLCEFSVQWFRAEEAIKAFERLEAKVLMASVQELRYAGRRFAQIIDICYKNSGELSETDLKSLEIHLIESIQNCIKARHDAVDGAVHFIHKRIDLLVSAVGLNEVRTHFPNFNLLEAEIKAIDKKIIEARADRAKLDANYDAMLKEHGDKLYEFYKQLQNSESAIRAALEAQEAIKKKELHDQEERYKGLLQAQEEQNKKLLESQENIHRKSMNDQKRDAVKTLFISLLAGFILGILASVIASKIDRYLLSVSEKSIKSAMSTLGFNNKEQSPEAQIAIEG